MAALTANRETRSRQGGVYGYPVNASEIIYKGGMVAVNAAGFLAAAQDNANHQVVGVAAETVDNSSGSNGDLTAQVLSGRAFLLDATSIAQTDVGVLMYVVDDQTFDETDPGNGAIAGRLVEFVSATSGWLWIEDGGHRVAGTADGTYSSNEQDILNAIVS